VVGRKRHVLTDTLGLLLAVDVHPASVQDRDGAEALLRQARRSFPFVERIIGDAGYQGRKMEAAVARTGTWELQIVRRCDRHRFVVLPKRWIVERTLAWISRCRRLARDYERHARKAARLRPPHHDPPHAAPPRPNTMITNPNFPERLLDVVPTVIIAEASMSIEVFASAIAGPGTPDPVQPAAPGRIVRIDRAIVLRRRGPEVRLIIEGPGACEPEPDPALIKALAQAHRSWGDLLAQRFVRCVKIIAGRQPPELTLHAFLRP
jgi:transposase